MISLKLMNNIAIQNYFIFTFVKKREIASIILTLQMAQVVSFLKVQVEIVFIVNHLNRATHGHHVSCPFLASNWSDLHWD